MFLFNIVLRELYIGSKWSGNIIFIAIFYCILLFVCFIIIFQLQNNVWNDAAALQFFSKNQQGVWVDIAKKAYTFCKERVQSKLYCFKLLLS